MPPATKSDATITEITKTAGRSALCRAYAAGNQRRRYDYRKRINALNLTPHKFFYKTLTTMYKYWFVTFSTFGSWLPGDERGSHRWNGDAIKPNRALQSFVQIGMRREPVRLINASERQCAFQAIVTLEGINAMTTVAGGIRATRRASACGFYVFISRAAFR